MHVPVGAWFSQMQLSRPCLQGLYQVMMFANKIPRYRHILNFGTSGGLLAYDCGQDEFSNIKALTLQIFIKLFALIIGASVWQSGFFITFLSN